MHLQTSDRLVENVVHLGQVGPCTQPYPLDTRPTAQIRPGKGQFNLYLERTYLCVNVRVGRLHNLVLGSWVQCGVD